jgi:hypothetical protein
VWFYWDIITFRLIKGFLGLRPEITKPQYLTLPSLETDLFSRDHHNLSSRKIILIQIISIHLNILRFTNKYTKPRRTTNEPSGIGVSGSLALANQEIKKQHLLAAQLLLLFSFPKNQKNKPKSRKRDDERQRVPCA